MQTQKKWLILGGLALIVVIGLAVGLNQGGLFRGALDFSGRSTGIKPAAIERATNNAGKAQEAGQSLNSVLFTVTEIDGKTYDVLGDSRLSGKMNRGKFDFSNAGLDRVYLKLEEQKLVEIPDLKPEVLTEKMTITEDILIEPIDEGAAMLQDSLNKDIVSMPLLDTATSADTMQPATMTDQLMKSAVSNAVMMEGENLLQDSMQDAAQDSMQDSIQDAKQESFDLKLLPSAVSPLSSPLKDSTKNATFNLRSAIPAARAADLAIDTTISRSVQPTKTLIDATKLITPSTEEEDSDLQKQIQSSGLLNDMTLAPVGSLSDFVQTISCQVDASMVCELNISAISSGNYNIEFKDASGALIETFPVEIVAPAPQTDLGSGLPSKDNDTSSDIPLRGDRDGDGVPDNLDNCPDVSNPKQEDSDRNKIGDACDSGPGLPRKIDSDDDSIVDSLDNCPAKSNPKQEDSDRDGVGDVCDNCRAVVNRDQTDSDSNGIGDACDKKEVKEEADDTTQPDRDADGIVDSLDNCVSTRNADQLDSDRDGVGDVCDNCRAVVNRDQLDSDRDGTGDACEQPADTFADDDAGSQSGATYNYNYNYYTDPNQQAVAVTQASSTPCVVADKVFYLAGGPDSTYCKDLQSLVTAEGKQEIFQSDMVPETPQARYTTALATLRILRELGGNIRTKNLSTDWYARLSDGDSLRKVSSQELADFRTVYASGVLKGRINPKDPTDITLDPLGKVSYIELLAMFRQSITDSLGVTIEINQANLPDFIVTEYARNPDWKWIAQAYSFGVDFDLISKNEFNEGTLFNYATRADMVRFLARFQDAVVANPSLIE